MKIKMEFTIEEIRQIEDSITQRRFRMEAETIWGPSQKEIDAIKVLENKFTQEIFKEADRRKKEKRLEEQDEQGAFKNFGG